MRHFLAAYEDLFVIIIPVAMLHGIVYRLCETDENVRIKIGIDIQPVDEPLYKVLNLPNATWV